MAITPLQIKEKRTNTQRLQSGITRIEVMNMTAQPIHTKITLAVIGALALMSGSVAMAAPTFVVTPFVAGDAATAADMNSKFDEVKNFVDSNAFEIDINNGDIVTNANDIAGHETRINALETASGSSGSPSADNPPISVNCTGGESLQAAIENAPQHGRVDITINGNCNDDIQIRRSGITIRGGTGPGTDSITGDNTGFSSDPTFGFNYNVASTALVNKSFRPGAVTIFARKRITLSNLTIDSGANPTGVHVEDSERIVIDNVVVLGGVDGQGLYSGHSSVRLKNTIFQVMAQPQMPFRQAQQFLLI